MLELCRGAAYLRCKAAAIAQAERRAKAPIESSAMSSRFPCLDMAETEGLRRSQPCLSFDCIENGLRFGHFRTSSAMASTCTVFAEAQPQPRLSRAQSQASIVPNDNSECQRIQHPYQTNPNRSSDSPGLFPIGKMKLAGILPVSVRILLPATPQRSPTQAGNLPKVQ